MNDEIKEILDSLDKIAKAEYYPEDLLTYKECQLLLDYITNLQEENERLKKENKKLSNDLAEAILFNQKRCEQNKELKQRCEKAIEYIKKWRESDGSQGYCTFDLLEILGGDE